ncbi:MAG: class II glutamine amidotransferase [Candidatus Bathyarchaeia archaeon]
MCRLFGAISVNPLCVTKYLLDDPYSLYVQSKIDPSRLQSDGWGIGFYINGFLKVIKSEKPLYEDYERFKLTVSSIKSNIVIAHVRRASNPRGLPREKLISIENSQPFYYGNHLFAHNGTITIPDDVAQLLGDWRLKIRGLNDSEVYFWYIIKEISEGKNLLEALKNFHDTLSRIWFEKRDKYPSISRPYIGLNMIFSDGEKLYAYCKYDEVLDGKAKSLCYRDQPAMQMTYILDGKRLIVASERTNSEENWQPLRSGQLIIGQIVNGGIKIHVENVE